MSASEKKDKRKGLIGTILFHTLLIVAFLFMGLTYQIPPPPEEGISINFGYMDEGMSKTEPEDKAEIPEPVQEEILEEQSAAEDEVLSQEVEEAPAVDETEQKKKEPEPEPEKKEVIEEKKPEINKKALYQGKKEDKQTNEGNTEKSGDKGNPDGDPNSGAYKGGGKGEDGTAYQLGGREAIKKPKPQGNKIEGKVVVLITVDRLGNVINAIPGAKGSTTYDKKLLQRVKEAALETKFNPKPSAPINQQGKIIYHFSFN